MTIEESIHAHLSAQAAITALVGTRIYQGAREQGSALPAISFSEVDGESYQDMTAGSVGLARATYQFDCHAGTTKQAAALRELVRLAMQNHINSPLSASGVQTWACLFTGTSGGYDPETGAIVRSVDFELLFAQPIS